MNTFKTNIQITASNHHQFSRDKKWAKLNSVYREVLLGLNFKAQWGKQIVKQENFFCIKFYAFNVYNFNVCNFMYLEKKIIPFLIFMNALAKLNIQCTRFYITIITYKWANTLTAVQNWSASFTYFEFEMTVFL